MSKVVGIFAGHGRSTDGSWDPGCVYGKYTEAYFTELIRKSCVEYLKKCNVKILTDSGNDMNMIKQVALSNAKGADVYVCVHLDYSKAPSGTLPLYVSEKGRKLCSTLNKEVMKDTSLKTRGLCRRSDLYELNATNCPATLFEAGGIKADLSIMKKEYNKIGIALAKGICKYLGVPMPKSKKTSSKKLAPKPEAKKPSKSKYRGDTKKVPFEINAGEIKKIDIEPTIGYNLIALMASNTDSNFVITKGWNVDYDGGYIELLNASNQKQSGVLTYQCIGVDKDKM